MCFDFVIIIRLLVLMLSWWMMFCCFGVLFVVMWKFVVVRVLIMVGLF